MADPLFKDEPIVVPPQATPEVIPPIVNPNALFTDQLAAIKNEEGAPKYDTVEKAIEALQHSQAYIPQLKTQVTEQEVLINELKAKLEANQSVQAIIEKQTPPTEVTPTSPALAESDVIKLLTDALDQRSAVSTQTANTNKVNEALTSKYGDNAQAEIAKKAKELGMKPSELGALSKSNPSMVLALFGEKVGNVSPTTNSFHISPTSTEFEPVTRPEKSVLSGATSKEQAALMAKIKEEIYRKHGITG